MSRQRLLLLLLALTGLLTDTGNCQQSPPRIINLEQGDEAYVFDAYANHVSINQSMQLTLTCEGDKVVSWRTPPMSQDIERRSLVTKSTVESVSKPYQATITVDDTVYTDTGSYVCYYEESGSEQSDTPSTADVYVFVNDPAHVFIDSSGGTKPIPMQQNLESAIPCLPSSKNANVTLWRGSGSMLQQLNEQFDPTKGFIIVFPSVIFTGEFQCIGKLGGITEKRNFYLMWLAGTEFVPTPTIHASAKHATSNSDYTITCGVRAPIDVFLYINWTYPSISGNRIVMGKESTKTIDMGQTGGKYRETKRGLTIEKVEEGDKGSYTCTVTDHNRISNTKSFFVDVQDEKYAYLRLSLAGEFDLNEAFDFPLGTESVQFVVTVDAFPQDPPPQLNWFKGEKELSRETNKYSITVQRQTTILTIYNLQRQDTGQYTLIGDNGEAAHNELAVTLYVNEPPEVSFDGALTSLYRAGSEFHVKCHAFGCPFPNITWEWRPCGSGGICEPRYSAPPLVSSGQNEERILETVEFDDACLVKSYLSGKVKGAGYYRCSADSSLGRSSAETPIFITEYPFKFGINASDERPFERDRLTLFCYASLFHYNKLTWLWSPTSDRSLLRPMTNQTNVRVLSSYTPYTMIVQVEINPAVLSSSGYYTCQAQSVNNSQTDSKKVFVDVQSLEPPKVVETNLNSSTYVVYNEDSFEFICRVTGRPTPNVTWYRNSTLIGKNESAVLLLDANSRLQIPRIVSGDAGHYLCLAINRAGSVLLNATLTVFDVPRSSGLSTGGIIGVAVVVILIFIIAAIFGTCYGRRVCKDRKEKREFEQLQHMLFDKGDIGSYNPDLPMDEQIDALPYDKRWEFPKEQLKFGRTIGQGAFGRVVKAEATDIVPGQASTTVAVKMLKERADNEQRKALMQELKIMIHIGRHINVVNLLGAITKNIYKGELQVIVEYCHFGNLRHYLLRNRENFINQIHSVSGEVDVSVHNIPNRAEFIRDSSRFSGGPNSSMSSGTMSDGNVNVAMDSAGSFDNPRLSTAKGASSRPLTTCDLLGYAYQTSNGMKYLSSKKLIHRDLALRNILLADGDTVKICDFGLAKDCYKTTYYRKKTQGPLPVKWMSIESIRDKVFSTESDIWSYGIILWELFTLGANPYPGMEVDEEFYRKLASGYRMEKPEFAPKSQYDLMRECWRSDPKSRPSFTAISDRLGTILGTSTVQHFSDMNDEYVKLGSAFANPHYISMLPTASSDIQRDSGTGPDYVNVDLNDDHELIKVRPQEGAVNYINMGGSPHPQVAPSPEAAPAATTTANGNPKVSVYGDRNSREDELEPMMLDDGNDNFYRKPPEPVPVGAGNPFAANSGYLDMGKAGSGAGASPEVLLRATRRQDGPGSSPPPRYTDVVGAADGAFTALN